MTSFCPPGKSSWPELVGTEGAAAPAIIKSENPNVTVVPVVQEGSPITYDFRCDRVRVFVDESGMIVAPPYIT